MYSLSTSLVLDVRRGPESGCGRAVWHGLPCKRLLGLGVKAGCSGSGTAATGRARRTAPAVWLGGKKTKKNGRPVVAGMNFG